MSKVNMDKIDKEGIAMNVNEKSEALVFTFFVESERDYFFLNFIVCNTYDEKVTKKKKNDEEERILKLEGQLLE